MIPALLRVSALPRFCGGCRHGRVRASVDDDRRDYGVGTRHCERVHQQHEVAAKPRCDCLPQASGGRPEFLSQGTRKVRNRTCATIGIRGCLRSDWASKSMSGPPTIPQRRRNVHMGPEHEFFVEHIRRPHASFNGGGGLSGGAGASGAWAAAAAGMAAGVEAPSSGSSSMAGKFEQQRIVRWRWRRGMVKAGHRDSRPTLLASHAGLCRRIIRI